MRKCWRAMQEACCDIWKRVSVSCPRVTLFHSMHFIFSCLVSLSSNPSWSVRPACAKACILSLLMLTHLQRLIWFQLSGGPAFEKVSKHPADAPWLSWSHKNRLCGLGREGARASLIVVAIGPSGWLSASSDRLEMGKHGRDWHTDQPDNVGQLLLVALSLNVSLSSSLSPHQFLFSCSCSLSLFLSVSLYIYISLSWSLSLCLLLSILS